MPPFVGIEIGGTKLQLVLGEGEGRILERHRFAVDPARDASGIQSQLEGALSSLLQKQKVHAIGVGFGGPVNWRTGRIARSHQIEGWSDFDLRDWLQRITDAPISVDNDANVAALGEARLGAGVDRNPVLYVTLGSGVGGGLVLDGRIYHGATPGESEVGHLRLDRDGTTLESRCSGWAVDARIRELKTSAPQSVLAQRISETRGGEAKHLPAALAQGDGVALALLSEIACDLAFGLSHAVHLFHPEVIVLGGGLSLIGEPLRRAVAEALTGQIMEVFAPGPRIVLAALGEDAVPVGALFLAQETR